VDSDTANGISDYARRTGTSQTSSDRRVRTRYVRVAIVNTAVPLGQNQEMAGRSSTTRNETLCRAMESAGLSIDALAAAVDTTPKSVREWRQGVVPRRAAFRARLVEVLDVDADQLWPEAVHVDDLERVDALDEVIGAWAHRADAPPEIWWVLLSQATTNIDLMAYAMLFLPESNYRLDRLLADKVTSGCRLRIALADPESRFVAERDAEERLGNTFAARIRTTLDHFRPLFDVEGVEMRFYRTPMYNSIFRGDDHMLVTPHMFALKGYKAPLVHYRRRYEDGIFDNYMAHFERTWATATPIPTG
jgi:transcriptional regulator with XRE-family HTH domain